MKKLIAVLSTIAFSSVLVACGSASNEATKSPDSGKVDRGEELVIYTNSASDGRGEWITERAAEEGFNIQIVDIPGGELADRLIAEKNNGVADMVYGLNNLEYNKLKSENLLVKYEPQWIKDVDMSLGDSEGYYYPIVVQPLLLIGKEDVDMPSDWTDLVDSQYEGRFGIFSLGGGTSKTIFASILTDYKDEKGELGISKEGWRIAKDYLKNAYTYAEGESFSATLLDDSNTIDYSMTWASGLLQAEQENSYDFQVMAPASGVPFVTEQTAILSSSKKQALAEEFINWFGSAKIQAEWSNKFGSIPANNKALEYSSNEVKALIEQVVPKELDWDFISENLDKWCEKAELEYVK